MARTTSCPACGQALQLPPGLTTEKVRCPRCGAQFRPAAPSIFPDLELGPPPTSSGQRPVPPPVPPPPTEIVPHTAMPARRWLDDEERPYVPRPTAPVEAAAPARRKKPWWILGVFLGAAAFLIVIFAFNRGISTRKPKPAVLGEVDGERRREVVDDERRREVLEAFRDQKPLAAEDITREIRPLFDDLAAALRARDAKAVAAQFNVERMVDELEALDFLPDVVRRDRRGVVMGIRGAIGPALVGQADLLQWNGSEIRHVKKLAGNEAVVIVRHQAGDGVTMKMRWWVTKERGVWQIFDYEDLDVGLRFGAIASTFGAAALHDPAFVRAMTDMREAIVAIALHQDVDRADKHLRASAGVRLPGKLESLRHLASGLVHLARNQAELALREWDAAARIHPDMPALDLLKGVAFNNLGRWDEALRCLETYRDLLGDDANVCRELGLALRGVRRFQEAAASYRKALDYDPRQGDAFLGLLQSLAPGDKKDDIGARFTKLDRHHENYVVCAQDCKEHNDFESLIAMAEAMAKIDPLYAPAGFDLALAKARTFKSAEALTLFRSALRKERDPAIRSKHVREFLLAMVMTGKAVDAYLAMSDAREAFEILATEAQRQFRPVELRKLTALHAKKHPDDPFLPLFQADLLVKDGKYAEADKAFAAALAKPVAPALVNQFRVSRVLARYHSGKMLSAHAEIGPRFETFTQLANLCIQDAKYADLEALLDAHAKVDPGDPSLVNYRLRLTIHQGKPGESAAFFKKTLAAEPVEKRRREITSSFLLAMVDAGKALEGYEAAPDAREAFRTLANDLLDMGVTADLKPLVDAHAKRDPGDPALPQYQGEVLMGERQWEKAAELFMLAWTKGEVMGRRSIAPRYEYAMFKAGKGLAAYGKMDEREQSFRCLAGLFAGEKNATLLQELVDSHRPHAGPDSELLFFEAEAKARTKRFAEAIALIKEACRKHPSEERRRFPLGRWLRTMEEMGQGIEAYRAVPDKRTAVDELARTWIRTKNAKDLAVLLDEHAKADPADSIVQYRGELAGLRGDWATAERHLAEALTRAAPGADFGARQDLYRARIKLGKTAATYLEFGPDATVFNDLASQCLGLKESKELKALIAAHRKHESDPDVSWWDVEVCCLEGDYPAALLLLTKDGSLKTRPEGRWRYDNKLMRVLIHLKKKDEALALAAKIEKDRHGNLLLAVLAYAAAGDAKRAIEAVEKRRLDTFFIEDCYRDPDLGPLLRGAGFAAFRERFPEPPLRDDFLPLD